MHIAFLTPEYPHFHTSPSGGLGTSIKNLAISLIKEKILVSVFVYGQKESKKIEEGGLTIYIIKQKKYIFFTWYFYRKFLQKCINREVKKERIDIIEAPDWTGITAFMNFECPLVIRLNGSDAYFCHLEERKQKFKNRFFEERALKSADAIVSVSHFTGKLTKEIFDLENTIPVIPNSVDLESFVPSDILPVKNQLLYFGTIIRKKGVLELAGIFNEVVRQQPKATLVLVGKDVEDKMEKKSTLALFQKMLSDQAKHQFKYFEEVKYDEIQKIIRASEVVLLPSFAEALPMTWLEAMAMQKPLVTSNIGWANEIMDNGNTGFCEDPINHNKYAANILFLMNNPLEAKEMGKNARDKVEKFFSTKIVVKQNLDFYRTLS